MKFALLLLLFSPLAMAQTGSYGPSSFQATATGVISGFPVAISASVLTTTVTAAGSGSAWVVDIETALSVGGPYTSCQAITVAVPSSVTTSCASNGAGWMQVNILTVGGGTISGTMSGTSPTVSQVTAGAVPGAPILAGIGTPATNNKPCNSNTASATSSSLFDQRDILTGNSVWKCKLGTDGVTFAWVAPFVAPIIATATTSTFASQSYLLSGCTAIQTVSVAGATQTNGFNTAPIFATAPGAGTNIGLLNIQAWYSGTGTTVNVQGCASGVLGTIPAFSVKVQMY